MSVLKLIVNEKAINLQTEGVFVFSFNDVNYSVNKIELFKLFTAKGLTPLDIRVVNLPSKVKVRQATRKKVAKKRAKKYYVKFKKGEKIEEDFEIVVGEKKQETEKKVETKKEKVKK